MNIQWLDPHTHRFAIGEHDRIELGRLDGEGPTDSQGRVDGRTAARVAAGIFVMRTFPAMHPEAYLSVRGWTESGDEIELGMIRELAEWSDSDKHIVRTALARRSLVRSIERVHEAKLAHGYLDLDVETDVGRQAFTIRWTQSQAVDYGTDGKLLVDTEENQWVIRRVADLPRPDRERFLQYIYW